ECGEGDAGGLSEVVGRADDERVECVAAVQLGRGGRRRGGRGGCRGGRCAAAVDRDRHVGPRAEAGLGGGLEVRQVVVDDVAADELAGNADLQVGVPVRQEAAG